jgi:hypothetical protein
MFFRQRRENEGSLKREIENVPANPSLVLRKFQKHRSSAKILTRSRSEIAFSYRYKGRNWLQNTRPYLHVISQDSFM